jgi:hypothetical protein
VIISLKSNNRLYETTAHSICEVQTNFTERPCSQNSYFRQYLIFSGKFSVTQHPRPYIAHDPRLITCNNKRKIQTELTAINKQDSRPHAYSTTFLTKGNKSVITKTKYDMEADVICKRRSCQGTLMLGPSAHFLPLTNNQTVLEYTPLNTVRVLL